MLQLSALADDVDQHLLAELDFNEEANNTELIGRIIGDHPDLVVPQVVRPYVTEEVLVLEHIEGRKVGPDHGLEPDHAARLAREFFRTYVRQVAAEGLYHADPIAETCCSRTTVGSRSSTSDCWGASTTKRGAGSRSCCSPFRRTGATTSPP